ncbi:MAG: peptide chain release factor 2 [Nitrospirae bacterium]|nr:peptide chain release factor 2 [Nitrospirota bacterium]
MIVDVKLKEDLALLKQKITALRGYLDVDKLRSELKEIDTKLESENAWESPDLLKELQKTKSNLQEKLIPLESASEKFNYIEDSFELLSEEDGEIFIKEITQNISDLKKEVEDIELRLLLSGEADKNNAIVSIHPGAGGTESQDWAEMLMRMYLRWAETKGYKVEIADLQPGDEAGIKGVTFTVEGSYAYGYLKAEAGVHRLVRISPYDANKRRHTSFSAVHVYPEIEADTDIEIKEEDLRIDTYRASGAGGQHVNKTSSAVRIVHIPTNIIVSCQTERSQHRNKALAMKILKSRLYDLNIKENEKKLEGMVADKKDIGWGSQIRSYVLQPYRLVKDHRTNIEIGNVDAVLDGDIDNFIKGYLNSIS